MNNLMAGIDLHSNNVMIGIVDLLILAKIMLPKRMHELADQWPR